MSNPIKIKGLVESVIFNSEEKGFYILKLGTKNIKGGKESVTAYVTHPKIVKGMSLEIEGDWITHKVYGKQFKSIRCLEVMPDTAEGLRAYLSSGFFFGIGPVYADKIIKHFGVNYSMACHLRNLAFDKIRKLDPTFSIPKFNRGGKLISGTLMEPGRYMIAKNCRDSQ